MKAVTITVAFTATVPDEIDCERLYIDLDVNKIKLVTRRKGFLSDVLLDNSIGDYETVNVEEVE